MADAAIAMSETSPRDTIVGKTCRVGRLISEQEGWKIVGVAADWEGTPYRATGAKAVKGEKGDCSGTTNKIYIEAGFPYPYRQTATFIDYVESSHRFREINLDREALQAGDVLFWNGHMAIYAPFPEGHPKHMTGVMRQGKAVVNNFYTAFNARTGAPYGPYNIATFRSDAYRAFRYFILPGEDKCTE